MAGAAGRLTAALLAAALAPTTAGATRPHMMSDLAGAYREPGGWVQIIPIDRRHAYVHLYFESAIGHDLMSEIEIVMALRGVALNYDQPASDDVGACRLTLRRQGRALRRSTPADAPCEGYANPHYPRLFVDGALPVAGRKPASRAHRYPGEGGGYAPTVTAWRKRGS